MGFFHAKSRSFTESWVGHSEAVPRERRQKMIKSAEAKLAVWAVLQTQQHLTAETSGSREATIKTLTWMNADDFVIGIGKPIEGVFPVLAILRGSNRDQPNRNLLMKMGIAFVAQQLTEEMYERCFWTESLIEAATQVLSIQFIVVTAECEIRYDSCQKQRQLNKCSGWIVHNGHLSLPVEGRNSEVADAIRDAVSEEKRTSIVSTFNGSGAARLVAVTPMTISGSNLALIMFENEQTDHFKLREHFSKTYGLTKSESLVAHEILSGRSIAEAAEARNLSPATVRSYMKQVLGKTGTHKQGELILMYFNSILPITSDLDLSK